MAGVARDEGQVVSYGQGVRRNGAPLRERSAATVALMPMTTSREKPPIEVQVIVWVGLAILLTAVGAFIWLFVLRHGFDFPF